MPHDVMVIGTLFCRSGEGLSRDLRIISQNGSTPRPIITAIDPTESQQIDKTEAHFLPNEIIEQQIRQTFESWDIGAIKMGYLGRHHHVAHIKKIFDDVLKDNPIPVIVDPGLVNPNGTRNYAAKGLNNLKRDIMLIGDIVTTNIREAEILSGLVIHDADQMKHAAQTLLTLGPKAVLIRGGHFGEKHTIDILAHEAGEKVFKQSKRKAFDDQRYQSWGGVIASLIACGIADGLDQQKAVVKALKLVEEKYLSSEE